MRNLLTFALMSAIWAGINAQQVAAHYDMSLSAGDKITETVSQQRYAVTSLLPVCTVPSVDGQALRLDGYTTYVKAGLPTSSFSTQSLTVSVLLAAESYPMMHVDEAETTPTFATVLGNIDGKKGFALELSSQGDLRFTYGSTYANGYLLAVNGDTKLPRGKWCLVSAVLDKANNQASLYLNGTLIGNGRMSRSDVVHSAADFYIGKDATETKHGPFLINTFVGLIDDIIVYNEALTADQIANLMPQNAGLPNFNYPAQRYASSLWRPTYHGMPAGNWTNECHGMTYSNGKYHLFFQKNANGPYMSRLHWGHITSANLYNWTEEPVAIAPGENYDIKGCWSGCVYDDNGTPTILYTAVDNARAVIAQAKPADNTLIEWEKTGVIIDGRPAGLSDDFRDPYYFTAGGEQYVIVGTSKNNVGACTLHKLQGGNWTNDGAIFFQGANANQHGTFWEMPNVTPLADGKWLFTCTPLNTGAGVRTLCWVGTIGTDGKFVPDGNGVQYLELGGISRDGYGLLSPTIFQNGEKTLLLGIVPDKLPTDVNYEMGWAHNYSLPREISLSADGKLVQKPYSGLAAMRSETTVSKELTLIGAESLAPVSGRQIELLAEFTVASGAMGFHFLKSGNNQASLTYNASTGTVSLDLTGMSRQINDNKSYNGVYQATLPTKITAGQCLKLHAFVDGSIVDVFVNDTWAFSARLFPTDASAVEAEVFASDATAVKAHAWVLDATRDGNASIGDVTVSQPADNGIYDLQGHRLSTRPQQGIYIVNGKKYVAH